MLETAKPTTAEVSLATDSGPSSSAGCSVADCEKPAARKSGFCWAHKKRSQRNRPLAAPVRERAASPTEAIRRAALEYAEADEDEDFERAENRFKHALNRYVQSLPSYRAMLHWIATQEEFRREALRRLQVAPPLNSFGHLKWAGAETVRRLREAMK